MEKPQRFILIQLLGIALIVVGIFVYYGPTISENAESPPLAIGFIIGIAGFITYTIGRILALRHHG